MAGCPILRFFWRRMGGHEPQSASAIRPFHARRTSESSQSGTESEIRRVERMPQIRSPQRLGAPLCTHIGNVIQCLCARHRPKHVDKISQQVGRKQGPSRAEDRARRWFQEARQAEWKSSADVKSTYAHASIVGADRVVFNIKGNAYRLVVAVNYQRSTIFIKWLGSHKQYDAIDVRTVQYATEAHQD